MSDPAAVVLRLIDEVVNGGDLDALDGLFPPEDVEGARSWIAPFRRSFPDVRMDVVELVTEGERVAGRLLRSGTHLVGPAD